MKRIFTICLFFASLTASAQQSMTELFTVMPDSIMPVLTKNNRLDMIDFLEAKMKAEVTNLLDGDSEMTYQDKDSVSIQLSPVERVDLFLLNSAEPYDSCRQVICMRSTYRLVTTGEEEQVCHFYSVKWNPIPAPRLLHEIVPSSDILRQDEEVFSKMQ